MTTTVDALLRDMLAWIARADRPYGEVMEAWRTNCPRLPVWEDAVERGLVAHKRIDGRVVIGITPVGRDFLAGAKDRRE